VWFFDFSVNNLWFQFFRNILGSTEPPVLGFLKQFGKKLAVFMKEPIL
jgi:hypothetical protein